MRLGRTPRLPGLAFSPMAGARTFLVIGTRRAARNPPELSEEQIAIIENNSPLPTLRRRPRCYAQFWLRTDWLRRGTVERD
jgi:hypothetical protein